MEKMKQGIAVIKGELGGAKAHASLAAMIAAINDCYQTGGAVEAYSDDMVLAIADLDSALEVGEANRARANDMENRYRAGSLELNAARKAFELSKVSQDELRESSIASARSMGDNALLVAANGDMEAMRRYVVSSLNLYSDFLKVSSMYRGANASRAEMAAQRDAAKAEARDATESAHAACARAESLQARNDNQCATIRAYDSELATLRPLSDELDGCRASLAGMAINRDEWQAEARIQHIRADKAEGERTAATDRAKRAEAHCARFQEVALAVGAVPIADLSPRVRAAYSACTDRGFAINAAESVKAELLGTLDSVAERLIDADDALALLRSLADRL